ncbi:MAG TPA: nucleoside-diphosphate sugar epimerase/dehydratase [Crocinitomicaceae bacterium]|nr:nucleoside-diphosphate sugar epimerase/dehydratase [Crocinitomicaceae bacterium]
MNLHITFPKRHFPRFFILAIDIFLSLFALFMAFLIRFEFRFSEARFLKEYELIKYSILVFLAVKIVFLLLLQTHRSIVRHSSSPEFMNIVKVSVLSTLTFVLLSVVRYFYVDGYFLFPSSILVIELMLSTLFLMGYRAAVKFIYLDSIKDISTQTNILIYGSGVSGLVTKRSIEKDLQLNIKIIGYLDDDLKKKNSLLEGVKIYHTAQLDDLLERKTINRVIIAIQNPLPENKASLIEKCLKHNVEVQQVPSVKSWINGEFSTKQINNVKIEDLLGRKPIKLSQEKIEKELTDKIVLVTGAAGSIGSGLVRQIAHYQPKKIVLLDQAESPLYEIENELKADFCDLNFETVIADITNKDRLEKVFSHFQPEYIFHAAAYKHVPLMEENPFEAFNTNILGTKNVADLAVKFGVHKFVMISTDKAVNPTNVMGATKRVAEIYTQYLNEQQKTKFITTRFGNVLGSNGSVIPLFKKQIENGGPVKVTHPEITRFFMTIPEACQLVLEAGTMGSGGEIFVFDMGKSIKIVDLAKKMIRLSGLVEGKDIEIKFTGLRPGEKLYEEVLSDKENTIETYHPQILIAKIRPVENETLVHFKNLCNLVETEDNFLIVQHIKTVVPEYISNNSIYSKLDKNDH